MRLVLYTGKGGVGKTTTAATTAVAAAARGLHTLLVSTDVAHSLGDVVGVRLATEPELVGPELEAVEVETRREMDRHWGRIRDYLVELFRYHGVEDLVADELALLPGAEELGALLAVERFCASRAYDMVVVDCAPTDAALRLVTLPELAHGAVRLALRVQRAIATAVAPWGDALLPVPLPRAEVFADVERLFYDTLMGLRRRLVSPQSSIRLVLTPERMALEESRRAWTQLCLFGLPCDAVVLNRVLPGEAGEEPFFAETLRAQARLRTQVAEAFAPLALLEAPLQQDEVTGLDRLARHAKALFAEHEPQALLARSAAMRFERRAARSSGSTDALCIPLPGARLQDLEVAKVGEDLVVRAGASRRRIALPRYLATQRIAGARLRDGELRIGFAP